jgi:hypothetical protein
LNVASPSEEYRTGGRQDQSERGANQFTSRGDAVYATEPAVQALRSYPVKIEGQRVFVRID